MMLGYEFPDSVECLIELLDGVRVDDIDGSGGSVVLTVGSQVPMNYAQLVPFVLVQGLGGVVNGVFRVDQVKLDIYLKRVGSADLVPDPRQIAMLIERIVAPGPVYTALGMLDQVQVDETIHEVPFPDQDVCLFSFTVNIDTRPVG